MTVRRGRQRKRRTVSPTAWGVRPDKAALGVHLRSCLTGGLAISVFCPMRAASAALAGFPALIKVRYLCRRFGVPRAVTDAGLQSALFRTCAAPDLGLYPPLIESAAHQSGLSRSASRNFRSASRSGSSRATLSGGKAAAIRLTSGASESIVACWNRRPASVR